MPDFTSGILFSIARHRRCDGRGSRDHTGSRTVAGESAPRHRLGRRIMFIRSGLRLASRRCFANRRRNRSAFRRTNRAESRRQMGRRGRFDSRRHHRRRHSAESASRFVYQSVVCQTEHAGNERRQYRFAPASAQSYAWHFNVK